MSATAVSTTAMESAATATVETATRSTAEAANGAAACAAADEAARVTESAAGHRFLRARRHNIRVRSRILDHSRSLYRSTRRGHSSHSPGHSSRVHSSRRGTKDQRR